MNKSVCRLRSVFMLVAIVIVFIAVIPPLALVLGWGVLVSDRFSFVTMPALCCFLSCIYLFFSFKKRCSVGRIVVLVTLVCSALIFLLGYDKS